MTPPGHAIDQYVEQVVEAVSAIEDGVRRLAALRNLPPADGDAAGRLAALRRLWDALRVAWPTFEATRARGEYLAAKLTREAEGYGRALALLTEDVMAEIETLMAAGMAAGARDSSRPRPMLLKEFGDSIFHVGDILLADPSALASDHPFRQICAEDELFRQNNRKLLVLGDRARRWFESADVRTVTLDWSGVQRRAAEDRRRLEQADAERRQREFSESPEVKLRILQAGLAELREQGAKT